MDRLIAPYSVTAGAADVAPATGTPGFATDGNPATNTPATIWPAYQVNAFQEEMMAIIAAGNITPDRNNNGQVLAAIQALILSSSGVALLSSPGYAVIPVVVGGAKKNVIIQWGSVGAISSGGTKPVTLPIAYPTAHVAAFAIESAASASTTSTDVATGTKTLVGFNILSRNTNGNTAADWFSIGY